MSKSKKVVREATSEQMDAFVEACVSILPDYFQIDDDFGDKILDSTDYRKNLSVEDLAVLFNSLTLKGLGNHVSSVSNVVEFMSNLADRCYRAETEKEKQARLKREETSRKKREAAARKKEARERKMLEELKKKYEQA